MYADAQRLASASVSVGGSDYTPGDVLSVTGGKPLYWHRNCNASVQALTVDATGSVLTVGANMFGAYWFFPTSPNLVTGGSGSGCQLTLASTLYWPNSPWIQVDSTMMNQVLSQDVLNKVDQSLLPNPLPPGAPQDPATLRSASLFPMFVNQVRTAILNGGRVPLSTTPDAVPPEAKQYVLSMCAWQLVTSTPSTQMAVITEGGVWSPLKQLNDNAIKWLDKVRQGLSVTWPADPDPSWIPPTREGSLLTPADLESYPAFGTFPSQAWPSQFLGQP